MAHYLIISNDEANGTYVTQVEAKNIKEAARSLKGIGDGFSAQIYRVAGPPKTITLKVETTVQVKIT